MFMEPHYLQVQGVGMGICCTELYANLFLGGWERSLFSDEALSMYLWHILAWYKYIDNALMRTISINTLNLKRTMNYDKNMIYFLDAEIFIQQFSTPANTL